MNYNQILLRENRHIARVPLHPPTHSDLRKVDHRHRLSQPKAPTQGIKIKKGKLPSDFFLKKDIASRAHPPSGFDLDELPEGPPLRKKAESQRLHLSPDKGFLGEDDSLNLLKMSAGVRHLTRNFITRDEPKRDAFPVYTSRKLATATKPSSNEFMEILPSNPEVKPQVVQSQGYPLTLSPRKELMGRNREVAPLFGEESGWERDQEYLELKKMGGSGRVREGQGNVSELPSQADFNMTFFNAKSTSFPPINRHTPQ